MHKKNPLSTILSLMILIVLLYSCRNDPDKAFSSQNYHKDLAALVDRKHLSQEDTILISRLISRSIVRGDELNGFTYGSLEEKVYSLVEQSMVDISAINGCFERERQHINIDSLIMVMNPDWYINDTLKFFYATLLINGIYPECKALEIIESAFGEMISSDILANELIFKRNSFGDVPPYYNDDVADKKIIHFVFNGDRSVNGAISDSEKESFIRNGWKVVDVP